MELRADRVVLQTPAEADSAAIESLLASNEPAVRLKTKRGLLGQKRPREAQHVLEGPIVRTLLAGRQPDGGFGRHPYAKWGGAHWRLVSLVELGVPPGEPRCVAAAATVLDWLTGSGHNVEVVDWGSGPSEMITLNALRVRKAAAPASEPTTEEEPHA